MFSETVTDPASGYDLGPNDISPDETKYRLLYELKPWHCLHVAISKVPCSLKTMIIDAAMSWEVALFETRATPDVLFLRESIAGGKQNHTLGIR